MAAGEKFTRRHIAPNPALPGDGGKGTDACGVRWHPLVFLELFSPLASFSCLVPSVVSFLTLLVDCFLSCLVPPLIMVLPSCRPCLVLVLLFLVGAWCGSGFFPFFLPLVFSRLGMSCHVLSFFEFPLFFFDGGETLVSAKVPQGSFGHGDVFEV